MEKPWHSQPEGRKLDDTATDEELFDRWRRGDTRAGDKLFRRHFRHLLRFFQNKVDDPARVEDLIQDTCRECVASRSQVQRFKPFLTGVARIVLLNFYKKKERQREDGPLEQSLVAPGTGLSTALELKYEQKIVLVALRRLPLTMQIALELYYWEDMTGAEMAEALGIPENTVRSRIRLGKKKLGAILRELELEPEVLESTLSRLDDWAREIWQLSIVGADEGKSGPV